MPKANATLSSSQKKQRKKTRPIVPKKLIQKSKPADKDAPTPDEWASMKRYGIFVVEDVDGGKHRFRQDDDALVLPSGCDPSLAPSIPDHKLWVVRIIDIKARSHNDVWVRVKWYWSGRDVATIVKSFQARHCCTYELLPSDSEDYISSVSFIAVTSVKLFDERDPTPPSIGPNTFFCRSKFRYKARRVIRLDKAPLCFCGEPYNPDVAAELPSLFTMHFCPRPTCSQAYHRGCLVHQNLMMLSSPSQEEFSLNSREFRLLTSVPLENEDYHNSSAAPLSSRQQMQHFTMQKNRLGSLPPDLLKLARQPLVRPTFEHRQSSNTPVVTGNVAGNIAPVIRARRIVHKAINGIAEVPNNWTEQIGLERGIQTFLVDGDDCPYVTCPNCGDPI